jgi:hypothetical protein
MITSGLVAGIGLASFWLPAEMANAERPRGKNCIAEYAQCKAKADGSQPAINTCVKTFNQCVSDNKDQHYNPYGYPNRIGNSPAVLNNGPGISVGKTSAASGVKTGTAATAVTSVGTLGEKAINPGTVATTTMNAAPLSAPARSSIAVPNGTTHAPIAQSTRGNFRAR